MQSRNRIFDDLSQLMTNAMGVAQGARDEANTAMKGLMDRWLADRDFVTREEFDAVRAMAQKAREENEALRRVETGTFGSCAVCGVEILETRLRALPFAVRCIKCETTREQAKARRASDGDEGAGRITGLVPASKGPRDGAAWG